MPSIQSRLQRCTQLVFPSRGARPSAARHSCPWMGMLALSLFLTAMSRHGLALSGEKVSGEATPTAAAKGTGADAGGAKTPLADPTPVDDSEVKLGRMNAEENDRQVKLITDSAILERVNRIGQELARIANNYPIPATWGSSQLKPFKYTFKVVDDKDVNAYSLPGGFIYVHKGLIDAVRSDDELAGVLAHEIAHAAHHHVLKLMREQRKIENVLIPLELLAVVAEMGKRGQTGQAAQQALMAGQLYTTAKVNGYGIEAEKDADHAGLLLMTHSRYNPVGLYSFMIRLAQLEKSRQRGDLGIFRTHPPGPERVDSAKELLDNLNIPIRLADVDPTIRAVVTSVKDSGIEMAEIKIRGMVVCRVISDDGIPATERAADIGKKLTKLIDDRLQPFEVKVSRDETRLLVRNQSLLTDADAHAQNKTLAELARQVADAIAQISQKAQLENNP